MNQQISQNLRSVMVKNYCLKHSQVIVSCPSKLFPLNKQISTSLFVSVYLDSLLHIKEIMNDLR